MSTVMDWRQLPGVQAHPFAGLAREYLRISLDKTGRGASPEQQHFENAEAHERLGLTTGDHYRDDSLSASRFATKPRGDWEQLLTDLRQDRFGAEYLTMWEISRASREIPEWGVLLDLCMKRRVKIVVGKAGKGKVYDPEDAEDYDTLMRGALAARKEAHDISDRTRRNARASAREGRPWGHVPYGYRRIYDPHTRKFVRQEAEPAEAGLVARIFTEAHEGRDLAKIARGLNEEGKRTRAGGQFRADTIRNMLRNPSYAAYRVHAPGLPKRARSTPDHPGSTWVSDEEVVQWPAIVDRKVWREVNRMLDDPERKTSRPGRGVHFLTFIGRCGQCGGPWSGRQSTDRCGECGSALRKRRGLPGRECVAEGCTGTTGSWEYTCHLSGHVRVDMAEMDGYAETKVLEFIHRPTVQANLASRSDGSTDAELDAVRKEIGEHLARKGELADELADPSSDRDVIKRALARANERIAALRRREAELEVPDGLAGLPVGQSQEAIAQWWDAQPMSVRRQAAKTLFSDQFMGDLVLQRVGPGRQAHAWDRVAFGSDRCPPDPRRQVG